MYCKYFHVGLTEFPQSRGQIELEVIYIYIYIVFEFPAKLGLDVKGCRVQCVTIIQVDPIWRRPFLLVPSQVWLGVTCLLGNPREIAIFKMEVQRMSSTDTTSHSDILRDHSWSTVQQKTF